MIPTIQDFDDATALERRILEWSSTRLSVSSASSRLDLRGAASNQSVGLTGVSSDDSDRREALTQFRPLLFGTGWKVLDLILELALHQLAKPSQPRWTIEEKRTHAKASKGNLQGLTDSADIWSRICLTYDATVEARHALVHRRLKCDQAGAFVNLPSNQPPVTAVEQDAIQGLALYASGVALRKTCRPRDKLILGWYLNTLSRLHGRPKLPFAAKQAPDLVVINAQPYQGQWQFDASSVLQRATAALPNRSYYDLEVHFPDSTLFPVRGELEIAAQSGVVYFDPVIQQPWMIV